jgi:hypothetical protein
LIIPKSLQFKESIAVASNEEVIPSAFNFGASFVSFAEANKNANKKDMINTDLCMS